MPAADGDVIEEDIAIRVTTGRRAVLVEQEPRPGVRAALTTSNAEPCGSASAPNSWPSAAAVAAASCSLVKSARNAEVLSPVTSSGRLVLVVIGHWVLPSRLCWRRHELTAGCRGRTCALGSRPVPTLRTNRRCCPSSDPPVGSISGRPDCGSSLSVTRIAHRPDREEPGRFALSARSLIPSAS